MPADDIDRAVLRDRLASAVREAGALALQTFRGQLVSWTKGASSPVSEADIAVDALLRERLLNIRDAGWLSEETEDDPARLRRDEVWVVDPIDGTRAYLAGSPEWVIAAALVCAGRPVVAALYAPVSDELFLSVAGGGATVNGARIAASSGDQLAGVGSTVLLRSSRASPPSREFHRSRCVWRASRPGPLTAPLRPRTAGIGTLRRPIFWCTKPAGGLPR